MRFYTGLDNRIDGAPAKVRAWRPPHWTPPALVTLVRDRVCGALAPPSTVLLFAPICALGALLGGAGIAGAGVIGAATLAAAAATAARGARRAEEAGAPEPERFSLHESVGDVVIICDRAGSALSVSGNCGGAFGVAAAALAGRGFFEHVHVADRPAFLKAIGDASVGSGEADAALRLRAADRERGHFREPTFLWVDMRARRYGSVAGGETQEVGAVALLRNITEMKWRQEELESARERVERTSLSKDHFLANMSHELRTPLNAIIGFSEILGDCEQTPRESGKQREYARIIHQSGLHLLSVVNSILDLSKIHSGTFQLAPGHFLVAPLIDVCCDMVRLEAEERRIRLLRDCSEALGEVVGDKRACKQILINLLSNAVKFTPCEGEVTISARCEDGSLLIAVADSGIGIAAPDLERLGDPFFQARGALNRPFEGTGLGLSIVSGLVGLHGGSMAVASEPEQGTCVIVRLPMDCRGASNAKRGAIRIETIARYRRGDEQRGLIETAMVKKIA